MSEAIETAIEALWAVLVELSEAGAEGAALGQRDAGAKDAQVLEQLARDMADVATAAAGARPSPQRNNAMTDSADDLVSLDLNQLRAAWQARLHEAPPAYRSRDLFLRALIYRLECRRHGGPSTALKRQLADLAAGYLADPDFAPTPTSTPQAGARLSRDWNGVRHVVHVTEAGFRYGDEDYPSLTLIARKITGAHRSGPAFFGVAKGGVDG